MDGENVVCVCVCVCMYIYIFIYIYIYIYNSAFKKKEILPFATL